MQSGDGLCRHLRGPDRVDHVIAADLVAFGQMADEMLRGKGGSKWCQVAFLERKRREALGT